MQKSVKLNLNINEKNILYINTYYYSYFIYLCKWRKRNRSWWPDRPLCRIFSYRRSDYFTWRRSFFHKFLSHRKRCFRCHKYSFGSNIHSTPKHRNRSRLRIFIFKCRSNGTLRKTFCHTTSRVRRLFTFSARNSADDILNV